MKNIITSDELASRWSIDSKTLANWRHKKQGPPYVKIEGCIRYKLQDIEKYERNNIKNL